MVTKLGEKCEVSDLLEGSERWSRLRADREVQREFESIMVNRQVVPKLNELESLIAEAATRRTSSNGPEPTPYVPLTAKILHAKQY